MHPASCGASRPTDWLNGGADWRADTIIMARKSENALQTLGAKPRPMELVLGRTKHIWVIAASIDPLPASITNEQEQTCNCHEENNLQTLQKIIVPVWIGDHTGLDQQSDRPNSPGDMQQPGRDHARIKEALADDPKNEMKYGLRDVEVRHPGSLGQVSHCPKAEERHRNPNDHIYHEYGIRVEETSLRVDPVNIPVHKLCKATGENILINLVEHVKRCGHQYGEQERTLRQDKHNQVDRQENADDQTDPGPIFLEPDEISLKSHEHLLFRLSVRKLVNEEQIIIPTLFNYFTEYSWFAYNSR
jgi:uncharacterized protein YheU (UPF0270 family)